MKIDSEFKNKNDCIEDKITWKSKIFGIAYRTDYLFFGIQYKEPFWAKENLRTISDFRRYLMKKYSIEKFEDDKFGRNKWAKFKEAISSFQSEVSFSNPMNQDYIIHHGSKKFLDYIPLLMPHNADTKKKIHNGELFSLSGLPFDYWRDKQEQLKDDRPAVTLSIDKYLPLLWVDTDGNHRTYATYRELLNDSVEKNLSFYNYKVGQFYKIVDRIEFSKNSVLIKMDYPRNNRDAQMNTIKRIQKTLLKYPILVCLLYFLKNYDINSN